MTTAGTGYRAGVDPFATGARAVVQDDEDELTTAPGGVPNIGATALPILEDDEDEGLAHIGGNPAAAARTTPRSNWTGLFIVLLIGLVALTCILGVGYVGWNYINEMKNQPPAPIAKVGTPTPSKGQQVIKDAKPGSTIEITDACGNKISKTVPQIVNGRNSRITVGNGNCAVFVEFQPSQ